VCIEQIAPYVSGAVDAGNELKGLGLDTARFFILHMQSIVSGKRNYTGDQTFCTVDGIDVYNADFRDRFVLYAVEIDDDGTLCITVILAGSIGAFLGPGDSRGVLSGAAIAAIRSIVERRVRDFFQ